MTIRAIAFILLITAGCLWFFWNEDGFQKQPGGGVPPAASVASVPDSAQSQSQAGPGAMPLPGDAPFSQAPGLQAGTRAPESAAAELRAEIVQLGDTGYQVAVPPVDKTIKSTQELGQLLGWATWCAHQTIEPVSLAHEACAAFSKMRPQWVQMLEARVALGDATAQRWLDKAHAALNNTYERPMDDAMVEAALSQWWAQAGHRP